MCFDCLICSRVIQLVLFFSKSLLRLPKAKSSLSEMVGDTHFERYLPETSQELVAPQDIRRHILCSGMYCHLFILKSEANVCSLGQVYYSLLQEREAKGIKDVAISRVEQFSPFPYDLVSCLLANCGRPLDRCPDYSSPRCIPQCGYPLVSGTIVCKLPHPHD
jgi:2-oxoglutarate dehydrogenase complex dehydrogenase (E1) component-like enzyme